MLKILPLLNPRGNDHVPDTSAMCFEVCYVTLFGFRRLSQRIDTDLKRETLLGLNMFQICLKNK